MQIYHQFLNFKRSLPTNNKRVEIITTIFYQIGHVCWKLLNREASTE